MSVVSSHRRIKGPPRFPSGSTLLLLFVLVTSTYLYLYFINSLKMNPFAKYVVNQKERTVKSTTQLITQPASNAKFSNQSFRKFSNVDFQSKRTFPKVILFYNRPSWIGRQFVNFEDCPYKCDVTRNRRRWNESDAVIFVGSENPGVPKVRNNLGQAWVFFNLESPANYRANFRKWNNLINWTMTYRLDSDIPILNHAIVRQESEGFIPFNKSIAVNWAASHCYTVSKRETFVKLLQKYIQVDAYGRCGRLKMSGCKGYTNNACWDELFKKYYFYLSFENSFCSDYVTEKAFNPLKSDIVPIVRGGAIYSKYLPLNSYINTGDFKNVAELSDHLNFLIKNKDVYDSYFDWRKHYVSKVYFRQHKSVCELCRRLYFKDKYQRQYDSVHNWWHTGGNCKVADDLH